MSHANAMPVMGVGAFDRVTKNDSKFDRMSLIRTVNSWRDFFAPGQVGGRRLHPNRTTGGCTKVTVLIPVPSQCKALIIVEKTDLFDLRTINFRVLRKRIEKRS